MKREFSPVQLSLFLLLGCLIFRLLSALVPSAIPNISPLLALAFVGGIYLPRRWGWLLGPVAFVLTDLAFLPMNHLVNGSLFSGWTLISLGFYLGAAGFGHLLSSHRSLLKIIGGSVALSILFYVLSNTFCWAASVLAHSTPGYPAGFTGWWQANTVGLPGYLPTWTFLRNGLAGDVFFTLALVLVFDPGLVLGHRPLRSRAVQPVLARKP